ncbi:hypothetical protein [Roseospira visakhapatnamensis]|uniref:Uncharacterized protein n=1 Tax=Roseospira visakhapatnamensis TaxID=390880 RepID=A0A7W6RD07_9PROT|nr:hypothetical protein [Roseospira visakhapatnamensis]MBB4265678.1 hypothetical protein [Roseospira visakhapatnamensis]
MATGLLIPGGDAGDSPRTEGHATRQGGRSRRALLRAAMLGLLALPAPDARAAVPPPPTRRPPAPARLGGPPGGAPVGAPAADPFGDGPVKLFEPETWGYHLSFPGTWIARTPKPYTVVLSGPEGSDAFFATVTLQNRRAPDDLTPEQAAERVLAAHREDLRARYPSLRVIRETIFRPPPGAADGGRDDLPRGRQLVVDWVSGEGASMRHWAVARPRPRAAVVHLWAFTAERGLFDAHLPTARAILDQWSLRRG